MDDTAYGRPTVATPAVAPAAALPPLTTGTKIMITNLDPSIAVEDVHELCSSVGPLKGPILFHYNKEAGSIAEVVYAKRQDAINAIHEYNGRQLDDRVMKVHMLTSNPAPSVAATPDHRPHTTTPQVQQPYAASGRVNFDNGEPQFRVTLGGANVIRGADGTHAGRRTVERREVSIHGGRGRGGARVSRGAKGGRGGAAAPGRTKGRHEAPKSAEDLDSALAAYRSGVPAAADTSASGSKGKPKGKKAEKVTKSAEDLDAELNSYRNKAALAAE